MRIISSVAAVLLFATSAAAQTFGGYAMQLNGSGGNGTPQVTSGGALQLLNDAYGSASSAFTTGTFDFTAASSWTTSFRMRYAFTTDGGFGVGGDGIAFVMQSGAATALGGGGASMGYEGIGNSVAVGFRSFWDDVLRGEDGTFDGNNPMVAAPAGLAITASGLTSDFYINVLLAYTPGFLSFIYVPSHSGASYNAVQAVDVSSLGSTVRVGFTSSSGSATQLAEVDNWNFSGLTPTVAVVATPEPATLTLMASGLVAVAFSARRRRRVM